MFNIEVAVEYYIFVHIAINLAVLVLGIVLHLTKDDNKGWNPYLDRSELGFMLLSFLLPFVGLIFATINFICQLMDAFQLPNKWGTKRYKYREV
jgi:amino acid transporter